MALHIVALVLALQSAGAGDPVVIARMTEQNQMLVVTVVNRHSSPITSLLLQSTVRDGKKPRIVSSRYLDAYVNASHDKPIMPGEERSLPVLPQELAVKWAPPSITVSGAIFADGVRFGSDSGVRILMGRRESLRAAIQQFHDRLLRIKGAAQPEVVAAVVEISERIKRDARLVSQEEISIRAAGSQVAAWVQGAFDGAPPNCAPDCIARRIDYVLTGLSVWAGQVEKGVAETSHP